MDASKILACVYQEVEQRFIVLKDLAHGWEHVRRVYNLALHLAEEEHADCFVVGVAALLHDLGRTVTSGTDLHHTDLSVVCARQLMEGYGIAQEQQEAIEHAILAHSFSRNVEPQTLEAKIVRDADRIDALGAIGIIRWVATGTFMQTPSLYALDDPFSERRELDDRKYMLDHFAVKLLKLERSMLTETGRRMAAQRTQFMRQYLEQLGKEIVQI